MKAKRLCAIAILWLVMSVSCLRAAAESEDCLANQGGYFNGRSAACLMDEMLHLCACNFPDGNFMSVVAAYDLNEDGYLTLVEVAAVETISCADSYICSLQGIEFFTALKTLNCGGNSIRSLDVSNNKSLIKLLCNNNALSALNVDQNTLLEWLSCDYNNLSSLDVSNNMSLKKLFCGDNYLQALDVSKNTALDLLSCSANKLTTLDLSENRALTTLFCGYNCLASLDLTQNNNLITCNLGNQTLAGSICYYSEGTGYCLNMADAVGAEKVGNVSGVTGAQYDSTSGIAMFDEMPPQLVYSYSTGNDAVSEMSVSASVKKQDVATEVVLDETIATVITGEQITVCASVLPEGCAPVIVTYRTGNNKVATVDANGVVTGVGTGNTWLYAETTNGLQDKCLIQVRNVDVESLSIPFSSRNLSIGGAFRFTATVNPSNASDKAVIYRTEDASIASVEALTGIVRGIKEGTTWIYAEASNGVSAKCQVTVIRIAAGSVAFSSSSRSVNVGDSITCQATVKPTNATDKTVTYRTGNNKVAIVDANGVVTGVGVGNTWLYAETPNGLQARCLIKVQNVAVESLEIPFTSRNVSVGGKFPFVATVVPANATDKTIIYRTGNSAVATVDCETGVVTGMAVGKTWLYAESPNGVSARCLLTVINVPVNSVTSEYTTKTIQQGSSFVFSPTVAPSNATDKTLTFRTGNINVATVDANGKVIAVGVGKTWLYATSSNGKEVRVLVTVVN